jgi:chemotaxis protein CheD
MSSPSIAAIFRQRVVVGVGDMGVSNNPAIVLSTYALGSCVAIVAYDPGARAAGLLHAMLPDSTISPQKAAAQPAMFVDTGLPHLMRALLGLRADPRRTRVFLAGGASVLGTTDNFKIGERNLQATVAHLGRLGLAAGRSEVGGTINRTVHLEVGTGALTLKSPHGTSNWTLA